jgi:hypothetical protein
LVELDELDESSARVVLVETESRSDLVGEGLMIREIGTGVAEIEALFGHKVFLVAVKVCLKWRDEWRWASARCGHHPPGRWRCPGSAGIGRTWVVEQGERGAWLAPPRSGAPSAQTDVASAFERGQRSFSPPALSGAAGIAVVEPRAAQRARAPAGVPSSKPSCASSSVDRDLVPERIQRPASSDRPRTAQVPAHHLLTMLVEQLDRDVGALDVPVAGRLHQL